jgi:hypothetical protein
MVRLGDVNDGTEAASVGAARDLRVDLEVVDSNDRAWSTCLSRRNVLYVQSQVDWRMWTSTAVTQGPVDAHARRCPKGVAGAPDLRRWSRRATACSTGRTGLLAVRAWSRPAGRRCPAAISRLPLNALPGWTGRRQAGRPGCAGDHPPTRTEKPTVRRGAALRPRGGVGEHPLDGAQAETAGRRLGHHGRNARGGPLFVGIPTRVAAPLIKARTLDSSAKSRSAAASGDQRWHSHRWRGRSVGRGHET